MTIIRFILLTLFLSGCEYELLFLENQKANTLVETGNSSTYWELKQLYSEVPKYSGAFGTYTAKHTPIAIKHQNKTFYTFSDNSSGVLTIYASDETTSTKVHESPLYNDPHSNASISVDSDNHILIYVSPKANVEAGAIYRSVLPNDISGFDLVSESWMAYPQPWETKEGQTILHTIYESESGKRLINKTYVKGEDRRTRILYVKNRNCSKKLMTGGHYQVSTYDGSRLHMAYNYHPDNNVDARTNLYYMYSDNGCDWLNKDGVALTLPLEADSELTKIVDNGKLIFLKDIGMDGNTPKILYLESTTPDPTQGDFNSRKFYLKTPNGTAIKVGNSGHNYNTGYYFRKNNVDNVILPTFAPDWERTFYAGGMLAHRTIDNSGKVKTLFPIHKGYYNYARKVHNGNGAGIMSEDINHNSGKIIKIESM